MQTHALESVDLLKINLLHTFAAKLNGDTMTSHLLYE